MTEKTVRQGELIRCNRCNSLGHIDRDVKAVRENDVAWRLQDFSKVEECGHLDCHWQYDRDAK